MSHFEDLNGTGIQVAQNFGVIKLHQAGLSEPWSSFFASNRLVAVFCADISSRRPKRCKNPWLAVLTGFSGLFYSTSWFPSPATRRHRAVVPRISSVSGMVWSLFFQPYPIPFSSKLTKLPGCQKSQWLSSVPAYLVLGRLFLYRSSLIISKGYRETVTLASHTFTVTSGA